MSADIAPQNVVHDNGAHESQSLSPNAPDKRDHSMNDGATVAGQSFQTDTATLHADSTGHDVQPVAGAEPVTQNAAGLSSVAQFLPTDAALNHPTPPPEELLVHDGAHTADAAGSAVDATMVDVAGDSQATTQSDVIASDPVAEGQSLDTSDTHVNGTLPKSEPAPSATAVSAASAVVEDGPQLDQIMSEDALEQIPAKTIEPLTEPAPAPGDQHISDAPISGLTRPREDDEPADEPATKRARTDVSIDTKPSHTSALPAMTEPAPTSALAAPSQEAPVSTSAPMPASAPAPIPATNGAPSGLLPRNNFSTEPLTAPQRKVIEDKFKNTKKVKSAIAFLRPVDPVALNIPNYPTVITNPMDLGTIEQKLKGGEYASLESVVLDFDLMVRNCLVFNGPSHAVSIQAQNLRAYFLKQMEGVPSGDSAKAMPKPVKAESPVVTKPLPRRESRTNAGAMPSPGPAGETYALLPGGTPMIRRDSTAQGRPKRAVVPPASRDLPYSGSKPKRKENQVGLKFCDHVLDELRKPRYDKITWNFREPVDPVALNIPHYFSIIRNPMDMGTITKKLKNGQYATADEFKGDFELMLQNCFKFNPADNLVHAQGKELDREFQRLWSEKSAWSKKNKPQSPRASSASDVESESEEEEVQDAATANNEETIRILKEQLANMQNVVAAMAGGGLPAAKPAKTKKNRASGGAAPKSKKASAAAAPARSGATSKSKSKKQRKVTYEEKQEISNATENMNETQINKLTQIIMENVDKYKNMAGDDVELEIDELPDDVQHKLLKYVRTIFPRTRMSPPEEENVDEDYEPERNGRGGSGGGGGGSKKKHKPMKKQEQESRIAQLKQTMEQMAGDIGGGLQAGDGPARMARDDSSGDDDSESSEEE